MLAHTVVSKKRKGPTWPRNFNKSQCCINLLKRVTASPEVNAALEKAPQVHL